MLNLGKKKEEEQPQQEVPDELPDLPQTAENPQGSAQEAAPAASDQAVPDELPPADIPTDGAQPELAPDELPPVTQVDSATEGAQVIDDQRLYFSQLLQKFQEEGLKSTKLITPSVNLVADMKKHWKKLKKTEEIEAMNKKVEENIAPLQKLEQEWIAIHDEIEAKKKLMHEKEEEIRKLSENLKQIALKAEKMGVGQK